MNENTQPIAALLQALIAEAQRSGERIVIDTQSVQYARLHVAELRTLCQALRCVRVAFDVVLHDVPLEVA